MILKAPSNTLRFKTSKTMIVSKLISDGAFIHSSNRYTLLRNTLDMILTETEIQALTQKRRHSAQARALKVMGITYRTRGDGSLVVSRSNVEQLLGTTTQSNSVTTILPNWGALA